MVYFWLKVGTVVVTIAATVLINYLNAHNRRTQHRIRHYDTTSDRNALPSESFERKRVCGICSKKMNEIGGTGSLEVNKLCCGHEFHTDCLKAVFSEELKNRRTCPYRYCLASIPDGYVSEVLSSYS